jgi:hypothetical protein
MGDGCKSDVGCIKKGRQELNLQPFCFDQYGFIHEMFHALGFIHEQDRQDRDQFLDIDYPNFKNASSMIERESITYSKAWNLPFDANSIMHYQEYDLCIDYNKRPPCMRAKSGAKLNCHQFGIKGCPTEMDKKKVNTIYEGICGTNSDGTEGSTCCSKMRGTLAVDTIIH